mgnify:FL=1
MISIDDCKFSICSPTSISFMGDLYKDGEVVAVAHVYQRGTGWHKQYPEKFIVK